MKDVNPSEIGIKNVDMKTTNLKGMQFGGVKDLIMKIVFRDKYLKK